LLKNSPFTWFDELTTGFDKPVLSEVEGLRANGGGIENILACAARKQGLFSVHAEPVEA
jgi:hypothetical protein